MDTKEQLELRKTRLDIFAKIEDMRAKRIQYKQEAEKRELEILKAKTEIEQMKKNMERTASVANICQALSTHVVDNDKTVIGSEPVIVNIWTEEEQKMLKEKLLKATEQYSSW